MEALLQNLEEQEIHLQQQQHLYIHDLGNMENLNDGKPLPPPRKYVSIFHIDGEPILPPLMTREKRIQMQKLKEKALKIEQGLRERKQQAHCENDQNEYTKTYCSSSLLYHTAGNLSQRSQDYYENNLKETEESMVLLKDLIERQQEGTEETFEDTAFSTSAYFHGDKNQEKLRKLQKSEILIYDNSTNEVIQVPAEKDKKTAEDQRRLIKKIETQTNFIYVPNNKPSHLLLEGVNSKGTTAIPLICLNPPTPLTVNKSFCETLSGAESSESFIVSDSLQKSLDLRQDLSSDESFNSMITQSDKKSNRNARQNIVKPATIGESYKNVDRKLLTQSKNVCGKIQQFEAISSDNNTPQTSPEKVYQSRKACLGTPTGTLSRSATSPSIKLSTSNRSSSSRSQSLAQDSPENSLVRSSSFTLEGPSKALIEHMQQQKVNGDIKTSVKSPLNTTSNLSRKLVSSPLRAHRDTVESKAKKVQKVELKSSRQKIQQKASQSKLAQAAAASISPYNSNSLCKTKRSPCNISKTFHGPLQTLPKTSSTQMRKSNSSSSNLAQTKTSKSKLASSTSTSCNAARTPQTDKETFSQMAKAQKEKFLQLLFQQEEEHQRLQQSFEIQQKLLIEQLNREMAASQVKSPHNSDNSSSIVSTLEHKRFDSQQILLPQQQNQLNSTGFPLDHGSQKPPSLKQYKTQTNQHLASPSSISNNSSYILVNKSQSQIFNSQNSMYASHYIQSSQPIPLSPHLTLMDHSNANTSLDISTLSTQTSPDVIHATPAIQNTVHNVVGNKTTPSSRRRLFEAEITDVAVTAPIARSIAASSPYASQRFLEHSQQLNISNKSLIPLTNDSNRRSPAENSLLLHAAATKINAYARGFLVRRLFQTEQIQRIVQTIRDTLIFVLNLHIETIENPEESRTPANIKLKARLLQQLSSACRTLNLVFFQTSIKERMEIIARDRKRIKSKLMSMNRQR